MPRRIRDFVIVMVLALSIASLLGLRRHTTLGWILPASCGVLLILLALVRPSAVQPIEAAWAGIGRLLGRITTPILLAAVFVLVVVPLGLLLRLLGKDILRLRRDFKAPTYWIERKRRAFEPADFERLS